MKINVLWILLGIVLFTAFYFGGADDPVAFSVSDLGQLTDVDPRGEVPFLERGLDDTGIDYDNVFGYSYAVAGCQDLACTDSQASLLVGERTLTTFSFPACGFVDTLDGSFFQKSEFVLGDGQIFKGKTSSDVQVLGGCDGYSSGSITLFEHVECVVDADCMTATGSNLQRTATGVCIEETHTCDFDLERKGTQRVSLESFKNTVSDILNRIIAFFRGLSK